MGDGPMLYTRQEAAERLSVSLSTLTRLCKLGQLRVVRVGRSVRIPRDSVVDYVNGRPGTAFDDRKPEAPSLSTWPPTPSLFDPGLTEALEALEALEQIPHTATCTHCDWGEHFPTWSDARAAAATHGEICPDAVTECHPTAGREPG